MIYIIKTLMSLSILILTTSLINIKNKRYTFVIREIYIHDNELIFFEETDLVI